MHRPHLTLSRDADVRIAESELLGGVWLEPVIPGIVWLSLGKTVKITTSATVLLVEKRPDGYYISGLLPLPTKCVIHGSTWGGSMLKMKFIGRGMFLELSIEGKTLTSFEIEEVAEV